MKMQHGGARSNHHALWLVAVALAAITLLGCSSDGKGTPTGQGSDSGESGSGASQSSGSAEVNGTFAGGDWSAKSAIFATQTNLSGADGFVVTSVFVSDVANACAAIAKHESGSESGHALLLYLVGNSALAPGKLEILTGESTTPRAGSLVSYFFGSGCQTSSEGARRGSVTVTKAGSAVIEANFDVTLEQIDADENPIPDTSHEVTGSFSASFCKAWGEALDPSNDDGAAGASGCE